MTAKKLQSMEGGDLCCHFDFRDYRVRRYACQKRAYTNGSAHPPQGVASYACPQPVRFNSPSNKEVPTHGAPTSVPAFTYLVGAFTPVRQVIFKGLKSCQRLHRQPHRTPP